MSSRGHVRFRPRARRVRPPSKEYAQIEPVANAAREVRRLRAELDVLNGMAADATAEAELREMAEHEIEDIKVRLPEAERALAVHLLPRDAADDRAAMLELRAGTGGDEAALFAGDLLRMYQRYAELQGWRFELISASASDVGGCKEAIASINGSGVFARMKFESGVHRVQRVPATESGGRIHTSAATVAVLPEAEDVDVHIDDKDLRTDVYRSSGRRPGGQQYRERRITHLRRAGRHQQDEKWQHKKKAKTSNAAHPPVRAERERSPRRAAPANRWSDQATLGDPTIISEGGGPDRIPDPHKLDASLEGPLGKGSDALVAEDEAAAGRPREACQQLSGLAAPPMRPHPATRASRRAVMALPGISAFPVDVEAGQGRR